MISFMFPSAVAPEPVFRLIGDVDFQLVCVALHNGVLRHFLRVFAQQRECHLIVATPHLIDTVVEHRQVVFSGEIFSAIDERGILVEKLCPVAFVDIRWRLVAEHHECARYAMVHIVFHLTSDGIGIDDLRPISSATAVHPWLQETVAESLAYTYAVCHKVVVEGGDHVFPIVIVGGHQHHRASLLIICVGYVGVHHPVSTHNPSQGHHQVQQSLYKDVAEMVIEEAFYRPTFFLFFIRKGVEDVILHHLTAIADKVVDNDIEEIGEEVHWF